MTRRKETRISCTERLPRTTSGRGGRIHTRTTPQARLAIHVLAQALEDAAYGATIRAEDLAPWAMLAGVIPQSCSGATPHAKESTDQQRAGGETR